MKNARSIRFDQRQLDLAAKLKINLSEICRDALAIELAIRTSPSLQEPKERDKFIVNYYSIRRMEKGIK